MRMCFNFFCFFALLGCLKNRKELYDIRMKFGFCLFLAILITLGNIHAYVSLFENRFGISDLISEATVYSLEMICHYTVFLVYGYFILRIESGVIKIWHLRFMTLLSIPVVFLHTGLFDYCCTFSGGVQATSMWKEWLKVILVVSPGYAKTMLNMLYTPLVDMNCFYLIIMLSRQLTVQRYIYFTNVSIMGAGWLLLLHAIVEPMGKLLLPQLIWSYKDFLVNVAFSGCTFFILWSLDEVRDHSKRLSWLFVYAVTTLIFTLKIISIDVKACELFGFQQAHR